MVNEEILTSLGLKKDVNGNILKEHTDKELETVQSKSSALAILNRTSSNSDTPLSELSYEETVSEQQKNAPVVKAISADFCKIGDNVVNVTLHRLINDRYSETSEMDSKDAAHISVNVQRSSDSGEYAVTDKDLIREDPPLFNHRSSTVKDGAIIQERPEGQMEATSIIINEGYEQINTLINKVTELSNILSVKAAKMVKASGDELKRLTLNMAYILNKGSIRNTIDQRVLASLSPADAEGSTKADRYEQVNIVMNVVNAELQTFAMSPYVATLELVDWSYSIMPADSTRSKAKGRKYFSLPNGMWMKVDMRGARAGGKYPISKEYIETFKKEAAKIQTLFLTVMENQIRSDLGLEPFELPEVIFEDSGELEGMDDEKIISYILSNNGSELSASDILKEARDNIKKAIDKSFEEMTKERYVNNL